MEVNRVSLGDVVENGVQPRFFTHSVHFEHRGVHVIRKHGTWHGHGSRMLVAASIGRVVLQTHALGGPVVASPGHFFFAFGWGLQFRVCEAFPPCAPHCRSHSLAPLQASPPLQPFRSREGPQLGNNLWTIYISFGLYIYTYNARMTRISKRVHSSAFVCNRHPRKCATQIVHGTTHTSLPCKRYPNWCSQWYQHVRPQTAAQRKEWNKKAGTNVGLWCQVQHRFLTEPYKIDRRYLCQAKRIRRALQCLETEPDNPHTETLLNLREKMILEKWN